MRNLEKNLLLLFLLALIFLPASNFAQIMDWQVSFESRQLLTFGAHYTNSNSLTKTFPQSPVLHLSPQVNIGFFSRPGHKFMVGLGYYPRSIVYRDFHLEGQKVRIDQKYLYLPLKFALKIYEPHVPHLSKKLRTIHYAFVEAGIGQIIGFRTTVFQDKEKTDDDIWMIFPLKNLFTIDMAFGYEVELAIGNKFSIPLRAFFGHSLLEAVGNDLAYTHSAYVGVSAGTALNF